MSEKRPESALDRVLEVLDAGPQSSSETGARLGDPHRCARCLATDRAPQSEFCAECRAFLLEDSTEDPVKEELNPRIAVIDFDGADGTNHLSTVAQIIVSFGNDVLAAVFATIAQLPVEFVELAAELDNVVAVGQALGLSEERCKELVDEELERCETGPSRPQAVPERVRQRIYHELEGGDSSD